jgi:hypothetical protein
MLAVGTSSAAQRGRELRERPIADPCRSIWCDVGGIEHTERRVELQATGMRLTTGLGVTGNTVTGDRKITPPLYHGIRYCIRYRAPRQRYENGGTCMTQAPKLE